MARCSESVLLNERSVCPRAYTKDEDDESIWYLDNGASNHMTGNLKHFNELDEKIVGKVRFGDDSTIDIKGKGSVLLQCKNGEQRLITNVYYIPHLCSNILSLGQFTEGGCRVVMQDNVLKMYETSDKLLLKVERTLNRLYKIKLQTVPPKCLPNKMEGKIVSDEVANYDLIPAASHELNMSHMEGQNDGQRTTSSSSENQPIAASVSRVLEAGNQPKSAYFGAAGAAPENNITSSNFPANKEQSIGKVAEQAKVKIVRDCLDIRERTKEANDTHDEEAYGDKVDFFTKRLSRVKMRELLKDKKLKDVKFGINGVMLD